MMKNVYADQCSGDHRPWETNVQLCSHNFYSNKTPLKKLEHCAFNIQKGTVGVGCVARVGGSVAGGDGVALGVGTTRVVWGAGGSCCSELQK